MRKQMVVAALAAVATAVAWGEGAVKPLKVMMIGNSYSGSAFRQTPVVAKACGCPLDLCSLNIGGCTLERHVQNVNNPTSKPYNVAWNWTSSEKPPFRHRGNIPEMLQAAKWNVVTIQQASRLSFEADSYHPFGDTLVAAIRKYAPQAEIVVQETWSDDPASRRIAELGFTSRQMYAALHKCYADFAAANGFRVIPTGTAVEFARDVMPLQPKDKKHLGPAGEYLQALVWTAKLFKADVTKCAYAPEGVTGEQAAALQKAAMRAVGGELPPYVGEIAKRKLMLAVFGGSFSRIPASDAAKDAWRQALDCTVANYGIGGCGFLAGAAKTNDIVGQVNRALASKMPYDAYILWASTNDINKYSVDEQNAAIERVVLHLREKAPQSKVVFFGSLPLPLRPKANEKLGRFADGQRQTCEKLGVPYLDLFNRSGITAENAASLTCPDKTHLKPEGYAKIKDLQVEFLRKSLGK